MNRFLRAWPLVLSSLLAACAGVPPQPPQAPTTMSKPPSTVAPANPPDVALPQTAPTGDVWDRLRHSFAMADCDADPAVMAWARRYTRNPRQFETRLQAALPRLVYVQQVAADYGVAGEFVLLPWVESHYQPVAARKRRPAGMWQIMPVTAGAMGLRVDHHYDGRLDMPAAAHAVMKLLKQYHDQFHDWRVADYAYNAGEFSIRRLIRTHGMPTEQPVLPDWPVSRVTREHLAKLLAMACVVREPERFSVSLPTLPTEQRLVKVTVTHSMPIATAADHAGMSVTAFKHLNAAFHGERIDASAGSQLMLPVSHANQFHAAMSQPANPTAENAGSADGAEAEPSAAATRQGPTHTVRSGESLWQIARHYSIDIDQLQRLNHLHGHLLKPGQVLQLDETN